MKLARFWRDERGATEDVSALLRLAFIVVPIVILLIIFKDEIIDFAKSIWDRMMGAGEKNIPDAR